MRLIALIIAAVISMVAGYVAARDGSAAPTLGSADAIDAVMREYGLVDIATIDASIVVELKYATTDNFVGQNMYGNLCRAYFRPEIAKSIAAVQQELKKIDERYSLVIYDAARPQSVQRRMYEVVRNTPNRRYVARPEHGGHHNFGIAVDLSILYDGKLVDMGSEFDSFSTLSHIDDEPALLKAGRLSKQAYNNRRLLRRLMRAHGFTTYRREWWHFQQYDIKYARRRFKLLDF